MDLEQFAEFKHNKIRELKEALIAENIKNKAKNRKSLVEIQDNSVHYIEICKIDEVFKGFAIFYLVNGMTYNVCLINGDDLYSVFQNGNLKDVVHFLITA
jgi:hypothetical protein